MHSKSYTIEAAEKFDKLLTQHLGMSFKVGINRAGKAKGYIVVDNIIKRAFNEIHKSIKAYLKLHPFAIDFNVCFVIRNVEDGYSYSGPSSCSSFNDCFNVFDYNCRDLKHHLQLKIKYVLASCKGNVIFSQPTSEYIEIDLVNSKFDKICMVHTNGSINIGSGTEITNEIKFDNSQIILNVESGASVDKINLKYCQGAVITLQNQTITPSISANHSDLDVAGNLDYVVSFKEISLVYSSICIKHRIKTESLKLRKSYISYFRSIHPESSPESWLSCDDITSTDISTIEGDIIGYKVLFDKAIKSADAGMHMGDNRFRIAKLRIPADAERVIPYNADPVFRTSKVEVLEIYIVDNDGNIIEATDEPAYNFMYINNIIEYRKGEVYEAAEYDPAPYNAYKAGIYCYTTLDSASKYVKSSYEAYNN